MSNTLRILYHLMLADFLERIRRYSFLVTLLILIVAGYLSLPALGAHYATLRFGGATQSGQFLMVGGYRGIYNSAWVGTQVAMLTSLFLSLAGFYLVKNTVERDISTGVGQIIATTPLRKLLYTCGKAGSNFAVLTLMVLVVACSAGITQLVIGEDRQLDLWALFSPFLLITLPAVAGVAALAILFECISWLRGGIGNVVYFFFFAIASSASLAVGSDTSTNNDWLGINAPIGQMLTAVKQSFPTYSGKFGMGITPTDGTVQTFHWTGMSWTANVIVGRLLWIILALAIAAGAAFFFKRFDTAQQKVTQTTKKASQTSSQHSVEAPSEIGESTPTMAQVHLTPLAAGTQHFRVGSIVVGELRLMLKGIGWWWYVVVLGLIIATLAVPLNIAQAGIYPFVWIWPLFIWSALGNREIHNQTNQLVFSITHPLLRQLPLQWLAGVLIALLVACGMGLHFFIAGDGHGALAVLVGILFVPTLALALGTWSGTSKLFEALYLLIWYLGILNHFPYLDFVGTSKAAFVMQSPVIVLAIVAALLALAFLGRRQQMQI